MFSATRPYSLLGSSSEATAKRVEDLADPGGRDPLTTKGLSVSKVPIAASRIVPPFGASGLT